MLDQFHGRDVPMPQLDVDTGESGPAMHPQWFFRSFEAWDWWEQELLPLVERGPVLDLGAGAGRASLYLQAQRDRRHRCRLVSGAAEVCRLRGVRDVRLADLHEIPDDREWAAVLLLCGNLGLGGSWDGNRRLLTDLARRTAPDALLVGDTVEPGGAADVRLRIRYRDMVTPWWAQRNMPKTEIPALVEGTGWRVERHLADGDDHGPSPTRVTANLRQRMGNRPGS